MKIVFICGSLEPGRDGVGDYTRRLAGELIKQGHLVAAIALNDRNIPTEFDGVQHAEGGTLQVLRVPSVWPERGRFARAKEWINAFNPEWLSLQFVIFSFHPKGLPFGLTKLLKVLGEQRRWHIMFHELWVGTSKYSPLQYVLWGWAQQQFVQYLVSQLKPAIIHTHTRFYQALLKELGFSAQYLPLFSNIPVYSKTDSKTSLVKVPNSNDKVISLIVFGTVHPRSPIKQFAQEAARYAKQKGMQISLTMVGKCGKEQERWAAAWSLDGLYVKLVGEQPPERVSEMLQNASIGISTNPVALVEKSGTVAAMQEHGLPVLCVAEPWKPRVSTISVDAPSGVYGYKAGSLEEYLSLKGSHRSSSTLVEVASQFVKNLCLGTEVRSRNYAASSLF